MGIGYDAALHAFHNKELNVIAGVPIHKHSICWKSTQFLHLHATKTQASGIGLVGLGCLSLNLHIEVAIAVSLMLASDLGDNEMDCPEPMLESGQEIQYTSGVLSMHCQALPDQNTNGSKVNAGICNGLRMSINCR